MLAPGDCTAQIAGGCWSAENAWVPIKFKIPAFVGNSLLLLLGVFMMMRGDVVIGAALAALAALDLFLVYKLDQFSQEEVWLAHQLEVAKLREQLLAAQEHIKQLQAGAPAAASSAQPIEHPASNVAKKS